MKTQNSGRSRGFTLIELLVVIAIIAVLAGAGFAAGNAAVQKARRMAALSTITGIETAVSNFFTEYSTLPQDNLSTDVTVKSDDLLFLQTLLGTEAGAAPLNARNVKFLNVKEGKSGKNGLLYSSSGTTLEGLKDPWGGNYFIMLDGDYDEVLRPQPSGSTSTTTLNGRRVAAWSNGADAINGTGGTIADDVKSW